MEFLKDDGLVFCSFFNVEAINQVSKEKDSKNSKGSVYLNSTKEHEKVMILYTKENAEKTSA